MLQKVLLSWRLGSARDTSAGPRFPRWVVVGAVVLAAGYLPTLRTPFDFVDDGNLVYPAPAGTTLTGHAGLWWQKVRANYDHLGPFRPTLWAHWEVFAAVADGEPRVWRGIRFLWCGLAAGMMLWLFRELKVHPVAALATAAAAMWNPYRNEIWTSLTLGEGVAMPYALLALVAARKGATANRPLAWDVAGVCGVVMALGCKNTFTALIPAQVVLRMFPDGLSLRDGWRRNGWRAVALAATVVLPAAHFVYFKRHWHPGQYVPQPPSVEQLGRILSSLKGAIGLDFLGAGLAVVVVCVLVNRAASPGTAAPGLAAALLLLAGIVVYLPMNMMSGRYSMPTVWGLDILIALLLTRLIQLPPGRGKTLAVVAISAGVFAVFVANLLRQEKFAARARLLWDVVHHLEQHAEPNAKVIWVSGDSLAGELNVEEGIHVRWHLLNRGRRPDIEVGLFDHDGQPLDRVELPPLTGEPTLRIAGGPGEGPAFRQPYQLGRKVYEAHVERP